ncbi:hypothetical protein Cni_G16654 [Canna indica]|uniref:Uncharacterized protein n=1 Tax=Canna indica TaxID=4628 RepID=A0AAQ3QEE1_9LILI|nr:hypothetical protein Cni_G16654 [Canna indica]
MQPVDRATSWLRIPTVLVLFRPFRRWFCSEVDSFKSVEIDKSVNVSVIACNSVNDVVSVGNKGGGEIRAMGNKEETEVTVGVKCLKNIGQQKQPSSWAALFGEAQVLEEFSEKEGQDEKLRKVQIGSSSEVVIDEKLMSAARSGWTNYGRTPTLEIV